MKPPFQGRPADSGRREAIRRLALLGLASAANLFLPRTARAQSVLDIVAWKGQFPREEIDRFVEDSGFGVQVLEAQSDHDFLSLMRSTGGREFDLLFPTNVFASKWSEFGLVRPFSEDKLPLEDIHPVLMRASARDWGFGNGLLWVPHLWAAEVVCWEGRSPWPDDSGKPGYGDLWDAESGRLSVGNAFSLLVGAGLHLEATGGLPAGAVAESVEDDFKMRETWDWLFNWCLEHRGAIGRLCGREEEPCTPQGARQVGLALDGGLPGLNGGKASLNYAAAAEGPLVHASGAVMPLGARNVDEAHAFLAHFLSPEAAIACRNAHGLNPASAKAADALDDKQRKRFESTYGGQVLNSAYVFPGEPDWFRKRKASYVERLERALAKQEESVG